MINHIINWSIINRPVVIILCIILSVCGIYAIKNTPLDAIPDLSDVQVIIKTRYQGQAPQIVEDQITYPLSSAMLSVSGAKHVRGYSFFGDSYVYVIFEDGTDPYWARSRVLEYLSQVKDQLPQQASPKLGPDASGVGWIYQYALVDKTGKHDLAELRSLQDWFLKFELQTVSGVSEVATVGGMVKQYQVNIDPGRMRVHNLSLNVIKKMIIDSNQEVSGSVIEMGEREYMIRGKGYIKNKHDLESIPYLSRREAGAALLLQDIADINIGPQMRRGAAELNGQGEVVGGIVIMRNGHNALTTIKDIKQKLSELKSSLPNGVEIIETYDRSNLIKRAVNNLQQSLLEEFILVALVCGIFLHYFRSSLIIIISLPVGILIAFIIMKLQGINANIMSLGGIAIAIGAMVDAAIVMIENVHRHLEKNKSNQPRQEIILNALQQVGAPLFISLLIITISFLPVFSLQAQEGRLFSPLAFTKTYAMAAAAFLSITLVPALIMYLIKGNFQDKKESRITHSFSQFYRAALSHILNKPSWLLTISILVVISCLWPASKLGSEFMPKLNEGDLLYMPTTLPGISIGKAKQLLQQTDQLIKTIPEVDTVFGKLGRADTATDPAPLSMFETTIKLKPRSQWRKGINIEEIINELDTLIQIPGLTNAWLMPISARIDMLATGIKTPLGIKISGPDLNIIQKIGKDIEPLIKSIKGTASVFSERVGSARYIDIEVNRDSAAHYGLSVADVQNTISTLVGGMNISYTVEGRERYPINLRYPQYIRGSLSALKELPVFLTSGEQIHLSEVASIKIVNGPSIIKSEDARLNGWVYIDIKNRDIGSYAEEAKALIKKSLALPNGYSISWAGQYQYMLRAIDRLSLIIPIIFLLILLLLFLNFKNMSEVFIVMGALPLALVGGVWLLYYLNFNWSVAVIIGFIALAGVATEFGVVMLVYLDQVFKQYQPKNKNDLKLAVIEGATLRVRPKIMTVAVIIVGLLPIMLSHNTGSEVMSKIAAPMIGGMITAPLVSMLLIPTLYYLWKLKSLNK